MQKIIDRALLILLMTIGTAPWAGNEIIYPVLVGIIYEGFCFSFFDRALHTILGAAACFAVLSSDLFAPLLILILYEAFGRLWLKDGRETPLAAATAVLSVVLCVTLPERNFIAVLGQYPFCAVLLAATAGVGIYLSYVSAGNVRLASQNFRIRDDSEEMRQLLVQKNELLRGSQDREIAMATLNERNRIAREIHDNVGHLLSRSILQMGALQAVYQEEPLASSLKQVSATLGESMDSIRKSVHKLHNESIDLQGAIQDLIARNDGYEVRLDYDMPSAVPRKVKYGVLSIVTEAFENVRRHSDGKRVWITVMEHPAFYQLIFRDDGHPGRIRESGIGLHNMRSRIEELGGGINFDTKKGFRIFANIPKGQGK